MRPLLLSIALCVLVPGSVWAQNTVESENTPQLPVGQTFLKFTYPVYQNGKLKSTISAATATGITLNRADAKNLEIQVYDNGAVTTTVTSPEADLYVAEQKMRTKNTVRIERADMTATSQDCDFDLKTKKYVLRTRVKVLLKHFNLSMTPASGAPPPPASIPPPSPASPAPAGSSDSMLNSPGSTADTNSPSSTDTK